MRGARVGGYVLERLLGRGGMGEVWAARSRQGSVVALKRLGAVSGHQRTALAEISAVAALDHPNVMRVLDVGEDAGERFLVTELALGSLADRMPATWAATRQALDSVLAALAHTHARGLLHLDVKPENVLWQTVGGARWVLADFGLARYAGTRQERLAGTPVFMAPEQFQRRASLGPAADLYAVGVLAGLLVTGRLPFGGSVAELASAHRSAVPPAHPPRFAVPAGYEDWWRELLEKSPYDRPVLAADVRRSLEALGDAPVAIAGPGERATSGLALTLDDLGEPVAEPEPELVSDPASLDPFLNRPAARAVPGCALLDLRQLPLVGREEELEALERALAEVSAADVARWVVLEGPPGIGRRHLARSFAWRAEERGRAAVGRSPDDGRPAVVLHLGSTDESVPFGPALVLAVDVEPPEPPLVTLRLGPLASTEAVRLARNLAPLDEIALAHAVRGLGGHPGRLVARLRQWAHDGTLRDGPRGLVVDPALEGGASPVPEDDPLAALGWLVEQDVDAALPDLSAALADPRLRGNTHRARWLVALGERAEARAEVDTLFRFRLCKARVAMLGHEAHLTAAAEAAERMVAAAREHGDPELLADALVMRAHLVQHLGTDPRPLLEEAERVAPTPATRGWALAVQGSYLVLTMRPAEAVEPLRRAEGLVGPDRLGTVRTWLGSAHQFAGDLHAARDAGWRAVETFRGLGHAAGEANALLRIAYAELSLANLAEAERVMVLARDAVARGENHMFRTELVSMEGLLHELRGELDAAETRFREAIDRAREYEAGDSEHHLRLARVLVRLGRRVEAARHLARVGDGAPGVVERTELAAVRVATLPPDAPELSAALEGLSGSWLPQSTREMLDVAARDRPR